MDVHHTMLPDVLYQNSVCCCLFLEDCRNRDGCSPVQQATRKNLTSDEKTVQLFTYDLTIHSFIVNNDNNYIQIRIQE